MEWENFKSDSMYSKVLIFWFNQWASISEEVNNGIIGINIVNIRIVLLDIIKEYELNQFESDNNRRVYIKLIDALIAKKHVRAFQEELKILKEKLEMKEKKSVYVISKELSSLISKQSFAHILFDELILILENQRFEKKDRIIVKELTKEIIIDLVTSGVNIEDVKKLASQAFESYFTHEGGVYITYKDIPSEIDTDEEKVRYIDNLNIRDRLNFFRRTLQPEDNEFLFIFPIWGMITNPRGINNDLIFGCQLYNPEVEKALDENSYYDELFQRGKATETNEEKENIKNRSRCNVKILVHASSMNSAKRKAENKYSNLLSLLNLNYAHKHFEFFWDGQFIGKKINEEFEYSSSLFNPRDDKEFRRNFTINSPKLLSTKKFEDIQIVSTVITDLETNGLVYESNTILSVINLLAEAKWQNEETKLLNYWIAIESLANISKEKDESKFHFIKETISNMFFLHGIYRPIRELFHLTNTYTYSYYDTDDTVNIPREFQNEVGIFESRSEDSIVSLKPFYIRMAELKNFTTKESFLDEIENTIQFYTNNKEVLKRLRNTRDEVKLTIDYIYKCRNQIVHNGYVDKNLIPYLVKFSEGYANSLFNRILEVYSKSEFNLQHHFIKEIYEGNLLEKKLSGGTPYNFELNFND